MNIRRGIFRVWIALSFLGINARLYYLYKTAKPFGWYWDGYYMGSRPQPEVIVLQMMAIPIGLACLFAVIAWIVSGFRSTDF